MFMRNGQTEPEGEVCYYDIYPHPNLYNDGHDFRTQAVEKNSFNCHKKSMAVSISMRGSECCALY